MLAYLFSYCHPQKGKINAFCTDLNEEKSSHRQMKEDAFKEFSDDVAVEKTDRPVDIDPEHATFSKVCCK